MASSAFKSTTKRASIGCSSSDDSGRRSLRRSRSLSRFSHPIAPEPETETDYNNNVPRGKFVNTTRGSTTTSFPEISLDDLALELFSSSSKNDNESDGVVVERKEREGRSVSRRGEVGRWASDTASSRRKGRSVSRNRGDVVPNSSASGGLNSILSDAGSRRRRSLSVARTRGDVASSSAASAAKNVISSDMGSRRRRSLSVAKFQISDSESEVDHSRKLSNRVAVKAPFNGNCQLSSAQKSTASSTRRLGRSRSHKDLSLLHDGYSSQSSALTDEESKDFHFGKNGFEKIIRAVHAQKAEHPTEDVANGGLYEAMRKELRSAVQEIRTELNQAMGRNQTALASGDCLRSDQDFSRITDKYATKLEQLEKHKQDLLTEMLLEEQRGQEVSKMVKELPYSRTSAVAEKPSRARKWETSPDGKNKAQSPVTPKSLQRNSEKDMVSLSGSSSHYISSHGSWSPGLFDSPPVIKRENACKTTRVADDCISSSFDMDEYLKLRSNEELLFEMYRQRNRINSGGMLLCTGGGFY
ncbi:putative late blight resistance protein homolog r1b-14 [Phtheirospermum japonicum]|uniref:Putative late blight resistance protein homolog r1b-14 n=1 Tax=Phtheirospermum japonicum TaxID=374723 RepID=A0A830BMF2_9LAMI|nr:putative late blight resistance protein homolog r1b-14 [Phtheirospermum japonicum]